MIETWHLTAELEATIREELEKVRDLLDACDPVQQVQGLELYRRYTQLDARQKVLEWVLAIAVEREPIEL